MRKFGRVDEVAAFSEEGWTFRIEGRFNRGLIMIPLERPVSCCGVWRYAL